MTRSDILLDTKDTLKEMDEAICSPKAKNHVEEMADILEDFWTLTLTIEKDEDFKPLGQHMRKIFYRENK